MRGGLARLRPSPSDEGLSLVELMVSMVVFGLAASGIAAGFISAIKTTGNDRNRLAAVNLAQRELEIIRNTFTATESGPATIIAQGNATNPNPLAGQVAGQPLRVDGRPYTVVRNVRWLPANVGASPCDGSSTLTYPKLGVEVRVTWPGMTANMKPVESNTILTPPRGVINSSISFVAVKLTKANGTPNADRPVALVTSTNSSTTAVTASDGCAVFGTSTVGAHNVRLNETDYVDMSGVQLVNKPITITNSSFQRLDLSYDKEANLVTRLTTDPGYALPSTVTSVTLGSSVFPLGTKNVTTALVGPTTVLDLWPVSNGYSVWAGTCGQSDPGASGGTRTSTVIAPGEVSDEIPARMTPLDIKVETVAGVPIANAVVKAKPKITTGCSTAELDQTLGTTDATGRLKTSLPAGEWTVRANGYGTSSWVWPVTAKLLPNMAAQTVEVDVP